MDFAAAVAALRAARTPQDLFGDDRRDGRGCTGRSPSWSTRTGSARPSPRPRPSRSNGSRRCGRGSVPDGDGHTDRHPARPPTGSAPGSPSTSSPNTATLTPITDRCCSRWRCDAGPTPTTTCSGGRRRHCAGSPAAFRSGFARTCRRSATRSPTATRAPEWTGRSTSSTRSQGSSASPRSGRRSRPGSTPATPRGCGGGCWSRSASRTARAWCTAPSCRTTS